MIGTFLKRLHFKNISKIYNFIIKDDEIITEELGAYKEQYEIAASVKNAVGKVVNDESTQVLACVTSSNTENPIFGKKFFIDPSLSESTAGSQNEMFLIVRSLKNKEGIQKALNL